MERMLLKYLKKLKRENLSMECFKAIDKYYQKIKGGIFFTRNVSERLTALYNQYKEYPNLSGRTGNELESGKFEDGQIPARIFNDAFYKCNLSPIHVSTFVEYLSRLTILKNAVDFHLYELVGDEERGDKIIFQTEGTQLSLLDFLPESFKNGIDHLSEQPYFKAYPVFWQWFIFLFGGFILLDHEEEEYKILSKKSGIPVDHIDDALSVFDYLFPIEGGWFITPKNSNIKLLKTFPMPWRGIGANYRKAQYGESEANYSDLELSGKFTASDLSNWHNLGYQVITAA